MTNSHRCHACKELIRIVQRKKNSQKTNIPMPKNLSTYSDQTILQELRCRIKTGTIKIDLSFYEHIIGLSCPDYQLVFPDD
jgi:hypothetical protein